MTETTFEMNTLKPGDLVLLRWTGDRRVPHREGDAWATVLEVKGDRATVSPCAWGTTRYIGVEHVQRAERKVRSNVYEPVARRVQCETGTRLAAIA